MLPSLLVSAQRLAAEGLGWSLVAAGCTDRNEVANGQGERKGSEAGGI